MYRWRLGDWAYVSHIGDMVLLTFGGLRTVSLSLAMVVSVLFANRGAAQAVLSPTLSATLSVTPDDQPVKVYAVLQEQASATKFRRELRNRGLGRSDRSIAVLQHLKRQNGEAQAALVEALASSQAYAAVKPHWIVNVVGFTATPSAIAAVAARADVLAVNLDRPWRMDAAPATTVALSQPGRAEVGLRAINAPEMWARGYTGFGTVALTADTGVDPFHPAIGHKYAAHDGRTAPWFTSDAFPVATDCGDHGTHVNGTIMGLDRLTNDTIGVAPGAHWLGGAILCGTGTGDNLSIFEWALDPDGDAVTLDDRPFVINNSWYDPSIEDVQCTGGNPYPQLLDNLTDAGVAVVFSAGNSGPEPQTITPPHSYNATLTNAFTVGALEGRSLQVADFSSRGPATCLSGDGAEAIDIKPEVSAPGVDVRSCLPDGGYGTKSGTSMAAPHTAGAVLLLHEAFPELDGDAILRALYYSARDLGAVGEDNTYGRGIIDVAAAYDYLVEAGNAPTPASRPAVAAEVVAAEGGGRVCAGPFEIEATVLNTGSEVITDLSYSVSGLGEVALVGNESLELQPGELARIKVELAAGGEGDRFVSFRIISLNGAPADPRLDLGASFGLRLSRATPPELAMARTEGQLCLGSPVALSLDSEIDDPALVYFDDDAGFELLPFDAASTFVIDSLTAATTLFGQNEYRRSGGPTLTLPADALTYSRADTFVVSLRAIGDGILREASLALEQRSRVEIEVVELASDNTVGRFNRRLEEGVNRVNLFATLEADQLYSITITRARGLGYDPSVSVVDEGVDGFIEFLGITSDEAAVRDGSFFLFDLEVGYYDGCPSTAVTLTPDSSRLASERTIGLMDETPVIGQFFDVFDATAPAGTEYVWSFDGGEVEASTSRARLLASEAGELPVRMTLVDGEGCATGAARSIAVAEAPSSTREPLAAGEFLLWPNPSAEAFSIDGAVDEVAVVTVLDAAGRTVARYEGGASHYSVSHLPGGTYTVRLTGRGGASRGFILEVQR